METRRSRAARAVEKPRYSNGDILIAWGIGIGIAAAALGAFMVVVWIIKAIVPG